MDPYILHGDFDGDGTADSAVLVISNRQQGIVVCRSAGPPVVLGAGITFNDMKNLDFTGWRVHPRNKRVSHGVGVGRFRVGVAAAVDHQTAHTRDLDE